MSLELGVLLQGTFKLQLESVEVQDARALERFVLTFAASLGACQHRGSLTLDAECMFLALKGDVRNRQADSLEHYRHYVEDSKNADNKRTETITSQIITSFTGGEDVLYRLVPLVRQLDIRAPSPLMKHCCSEIRKLLDTSPVQPKSWSVSTDGYIGYGRRRSERMRVHQPFLVDETVVDKHLNLTEPGFLIKDVSTCPYIQGPLIYPHFAEYCTLAGLMAPIECPNDHENARNSALFMDMCLGLSSWEDIKATVQPLVSIPISWIDCYASACMLVRWLECFLSDTCCQMASKWLPNGFQMASAHA